MRIGLVDIDGHNFPNLALMKLSAWHKSQGDSVEFADPMFGQYDRVYMSKVFTFTPDCPDIYHCEVIRGGTGFRDYTTVLPEEIEHICPDYSLYGVKEAYGFLTRGCVNRCPWCIVPTKEGGIRPASPIREFIGKQHSAVLLDNNVLASDFGLEQIEEIIRMGIAVDFNQGLDARRACDDPYILDMLARIKWIRHIRFACDTRAQLEPVKKCITELERRGVGRYRFFIYCLVKDIEDALYRINIFREMRINPFAQPYRDFENKIEPTKEQRHLANWCNKKTVFYSCKYNDFKPYRYNLNSTPQPSGNKLLIDITR